jgi:rRNA-processing protein FCF1
MQILLDTNFIITATKQKIDIDESLNNLTDEPIEYIIPQDVLNELKKLKATLALEITKTLNPTIIDLPTKNPNVDIKIVNYLSDKPKTILATLDKNLKQRVKNKILTIRNKKHLEII